MRNIPNYVMEVLRQRLGLDSDDVSRDEHLLKYSPERMVRELAAWHLGDPIWAVTVAQWMVDVGAKPKKITEY